MKIISNLIFGIIILLMGSSLIIKTEWFLENFGRIEFFEAKFGTAGGSRLGYKLVGIIILFIGLLVATGQIGGFVNWVFSPLVRFAQTTSLTQPAVLPQ